MIAAGLEGLAWLGDEDRLKALFLRSGSCAVELSGRSLPVLSPAVVFLGPGPCAVRPGEASLSGQVLFFHPRFVNDALGFEALVKGADLPVPEQMDRFLLSPFLRETEPDNAVLSLPPADFGFLESLLRDLRRELEDQPDDFWPCRARSFLLEILAHVQHCRALARRSKASPGLDTSVPPGSGAGNDPLAAYLSKNYARKITIRELAEEFSSNRTTIQKRFKEATGWSIAQYTIRIRVQMAALLLRDTTLSISEIIERTGFESPSHFSRMFRRYAQLSPKEYRQMFRVPEYILDPESAAYG